MLNNANAKNSKNNVDGGMAPLRWKKIIRECDTLQLIL